MGESEENQRIGYFAVIPATVLFNNSLKPNEKLLYAMITALSNKEGYCYASNRYLGEKLNVDPKTVSSWISNLRNNGHIFVELLRNENKEILQRKIYPSDVPYTLKNVYPSPSKNVEGIHQKMEDNKISINNINSHIVVKKKYSDCVNLYDYEYENLIEVYGENKTKKAIEELSLYKKSKGIEYASDYDTIKRWVIIRVEELEARQNKKVSKNDKKAFNSYSQREYSNKELEELYANIPKIEKEESSEEDDMEF